jgi:hypothetical protein
VDGQRAHWKVESLFFKLVWLVVLSCEPQIENILPEDSNISFSVLGFQNIQVTSRSFAQ